MSLPLLLGTRADQIPNSVPHLFINAHRVARWKADISTSEEIRVGIAWQGSRTFPADAYRSVPLEFFAPLAQIANVRLFVLQKKDGREQLPAALSRFPLVDLGPRLDESTALFLDTAAVLPALDLVITSDTSIAHLAGACGIPTWLVLGNVPEWRWQLHGDTTPWYPTMKVYRQSAAGDWSTLFDRLRADLHHWSAARVTDRSVRSTKQTVVTGPPMAAVVLSPTPRLETPLRIEVSAGELLDRISILEIKAARSDDPLRDQYVQDELTSQRDVRDRQRQDFQRVEDLADQLCSVNEQLVDIEDQIRRCENRGAFGAQFFALARSFHRKSDERAQLKDQIDQTLGSPKVKTKGDTG